MVPPVPAVAGRPQRFELAGLHIARQARAAAGRPLPGAVRERMEAAFREDFSAVRIHQGPEAPRRSALAFARGSDLHFAPGAFRPATEEGRRVLAHELAHVVQQRSGRVRAAPPSAPMDADPALEAAAERAGEAAASGRGATAAALGAAAAGPRAGGVPAPALAPIQRMLVLGPGKGSQILGGGKKLEDILKREEYAGHADNIRKLVGHWTSEDDPKRRQFGSWEHAVAEAHRKVQPKRVLFLGGSSQENVADYAERKKKQGKTREVVGTEFKSGKTLREEYPEAFDKNIGRIQGTGGQVWTGIDATKLGDYREDLGTFDKVKFEYPRTPTPVAPTHTASLNKLRQQDTDLIGGTFGSVGGILKEGGQFQVSEGGFPYRPKKLKSGSTLPGLNLANLAGGAGFEYAKPLKHLPPARVEKTDVGGAPFYLDNPTRHTFRQKPEED